MEQHLVWTCYFAPSIFTSGRNQLSGAIPPTLFNENMTLVHLLLDNNQLTGSIPPTLGLVEKLEVVRLDWNSLTGSVQTNISRLTYVTDLLISNNQLAGPIPDLTSLNLLSYLDMSNNTFELSDVPSCFSALPSLTTLVMEKSNIEDEIPASLFNLPQLQKVVPKRNRLSGTLNLGEEHSSQLRLVDLQFNNISAYTQRPGDDGIQIMLIPTFAALEQKLMSTFQSHKVAVDSVSLSNISRDLSNYLEMNLEIFPLGQVRFNRTAILTIGFMLSNQTFKPPPDFGPFYFEGSEYTTFAEEPGFVSGPKKGFGKSAIIGIAAGCSALLLVLLCIGAIICFRKKKPKTTVKPATPSGLASSATWMSPGSTTSTLQLTGSRLFSFDEIKKITSNFSQANEIGSGPYGKVYRGTLPTGQLVAVKRAEQQGSTNGGLEFKTEIELLSRVHHKNLVSLLGFCLEKDELILVYEFVPNGTLKGSLSGTSGIYLDWRRRVRVALGAARGLAYLHELANPPIMHRDIKSNNILLDENLSAKVSDFGLSKSFADGGKGHMTTEVKGTMWYLDPEYYMTQGLSEKSDVYSFGVLMLELITGKSPIDRGRYIVREVRNAMNRTEDLYGLHELLDTSVGLGTALKGFEKYVDVALWCVEESGEDRPAMGAVVKQLEDILEMAGLNPYSDSATSSATFDRRSPRQLYGDESLYNHSGASGSLR
ncbi:hypothetical protein RND81_13G151900 [Saponaria officinalis]|uniref:non-specific serine/threonine protein kinase n=1 Tax=Saponaria officinalis TaxID=3572 RepID=A0AAW1GY39_SAPOF